MSLNNSNSHQATIDKFDGSFSSEDSGCTITINETINLIRDAAAAGLYIYLASRPSNWKINIKQLMTHFQCGRDKIYNMIAFLIEISLLSRLEIRAKGKFVEYKYHLFLRPKYEQAVQLEPLTDLPDTVLPDTENTNTYIKKKKHKTKRVKNKTPYNPPMPKIPEKPENPETPQAQPPEAHYPETYYNPSLPAVVNTHKNAMAAYSEAFEMFWSIYPRKTGKAVAAAKWAASGYDAIAVQIIEKISEQVRCDQSFLKGYVPNPVKYLDERRFEDDVYYTPVDKSAGGSRPRFDHDDRSWADASRRSMFD